jgi:hypothetical protein
LVAADRQDYSNFETEYPCTDAGDVWVGTRIVSCPLCVAGKNGEFSASFIAIINGVPTVDIGTASEFAIGKLQAKKDEFVVYKFKTTNPAQTAHFQILKCGSCIIDQFAYFFAPASMSLADATKPENEFKNSTTAMDLSRRLELPVPTAGEYQLVVKAGSAGEKTELWARYKLNAEPGKDFEKAECPYGKCGADDAKACGKCNKNGCNWCGGTQGECVQVSCNKPEDLIAEESKCTDMEVVCKSNKDCRSCVGTKGCLFCDTAATFGGSSGSCTSGVDGLGQQCNVLAGIKFTKMFTKAADCPSAASSVVLSAMAVVFLGLLSML